MATDLVARAQCHQYSDKIAGRRQADAQRERTRLFLYNKPRGARDHACRPGKAADHFREIAEEPAARGQRRAARSQHRRPAAADQRRRPRPRAGTAANRLAAPLSRVRAHGSDPAAAARSLAQGRRRWTAFAYGAIEATVDRMQGANVWLTFAIREGKNREVRNVHGTSRPAGEPADPRYPSGRSSSASWTEGAVEEVRHPASARATRRKDRHAGRSRLLRADFEIEERGSQRPTAPRRPTRRRDDDKPPSRGRRARTADAETFPARLANVRPASKPWQRQVRRQQAGNGVMMTVNPGRRTSAASPASGSRPAAANQRQDHRAGEERLAATATNRAATAAIRAAAKRDLIVSRAQAGRRVNARADLIAASCSAGSARTLESRDH